MVTVLKMGGGCRRRRGVKRGTKRRGARERCKKGVPRGGEQGRVVNKE